MELGYDKTSRESILAYGKKLIGKTFADVVNEDAGNEAIAKEPTAYAAAHEDKKRKGGLGDLIEERYFHYPPNSDPRPDFPEAGVELKATPYVINKKGMLSAKERLVITMIDYFKIVEETFEKSHFWDKASCILLIYYLYEKELKRLDYRIDYVKLFTPPDKDLQIIKHDFKIIADKVKAGKAHELSEADTMYLGAATKASTGAVRKGQPFSSIPAKPRAFAFKQSYMTYVLRNYIANEEYECESILTAPSAVPFESHVVSTLSYYIGQSFDDLSQRFSIVNKSAKNLGALLTYRMLGIKGNRAEEFEKANIVIKTIRIEKDVKIEQHMSFPAFEFKKLIEEEWEDCTFGNYLRETKFLFVVFKDDGTGEYKLKGSQFWNIPYHDLETDVRSVWEKTKTVIKEGLKVEVVNGKHFNNFPKSSENPVCHVRPHAQNANDTYELPDGTPFPKQCFWLDRKYILNQLDDQLKY